MNAVIYAHAVARDHPVTDVSDLPEHRSHIAQYDLDGQERAAREYCKQQGWEVVEVVREVSNAPWHMRLGLRQALLLVHEHAPCRLVAQHAQQLMQDAGEWLEMVEVVGDGGNSIAYLT
jgi:hypothetical protein